MMRTIPIFRNNSVFWAEQKRSGSGKVPLIMPNALAKLPANASILIGDRTADFGGGLSSIGYVMVSGNAVGTIPVNASEVQCSFLEVK
jgi:hypothetical protein